MPRKVIIPLVVTVLLGIVAGIAVAQQPPNVPAKHPIAIDPKADAATCFQCHVSVAQPAADQAQFCLECHDFDFAHRTAPRPAHKVNLTWTAKDCGTCHREHTGPNPLHQITKQMPNSSFCTTCHVPGTELTGDEKVGDLCARCHNLGTPAGHEEAAKDKKADFCLQCHQVTPPSTGK